MKTHADREMRVNWIKAWALAAVVVPAAFAAIFWAYGSLLVKHGLLPIGGAQ